MASFYAELLVEGNTYRVVHCSYLCHQDTDARGRVQAKVRHAPLELTLDVPDDDQLVAWANTPHKPLAGEVVFYDVSQQTAHETIAFAAGECVQYAEQFTSGADSDGAYVCQLTITAPSFELRAGGPAAPLAVQAIGGKNAADYVPSPDLAVGSGESLGMAAIAAAAAAQVASNIADLDLKAIAKEVNKGRGMANCTHITEAVVARLRGTDPEAVAPTNGQTRTIPEIEAIHNTKFDFEPDFNFHQAFRAIESQPEGTIGLLVTIPKGPGIGHIVTVVNNKGTATIIEGQHWSAYDPAEIITSSTRATRRYGDEDSVHLGMTILPPPAPNLS